MDYDALVIGGGPAGATAAILLARAGWSVAIIEKHAFPRRKVCGEFVSATNMPILDELGVGIPFRSLAGPEIRRVGLFARDTVLDAAMPEIGGEQEGWGRALGREEFDRLLLDEAARQGARVWQPFSAVGLDTSEGTYLCRITGSGEERALRARLVIAAHGSWERCRFSPDPPRPHRSSDLLALKAHFSGCDLASDLMPLLAFPGGYGGMVTCDHGRVCLSFCIRRDALVQCRRTYANRRAGDAVLEHILRSCSGVREALGDGERLGEWLAVGPVRPGVRAQAENGMFRVGNAAGEPHPIIAEGISSAMQSSYLLAKQLTAHPDRFRGLEQLRRVGRAYGRAWRGCFATRIRASALFAQLAMRKEAAVLLTPLLRRYPSVLTVGARISGKTELSYSSMARGSGTASG